jgi:hypothetical protein
MAKAGGTLFTYTDQDGVDVVVDRLDDVPQQYRGKMKIMTLDGVKSEVKAPTKAEIAAQPRLTQPTPLPFGIEPLSMATGVFAGLAVGFLVGVSAGKLGGSKRVLSTVMTLCALALAATLYATHARRTAPAAVIADTHKAKQLIERRQTTQQEALEEIERSEK